MILFPTRPHGPTVRSQIPAIIAAVMILAASGFAQSGTTGALIGIVSDPSGAVIPAATVEVVNAGTNAAQAQTTNDAGQFSFNNLRPGPYKLTVKIAGFRTTSLPNLQIEVNKKLFMDTKTFRPTAGFQKLKKDLDTLLDVAANDTRGRAAQSSSAKK